MSDHRGEENIIAVHDDVGYVVDVSYKNVPEEPNAWFVKFTAYRTCAIKIEGVGKAYVPDYERCRGGILIRVKDGEFTAYGPTGIFCDMADTMHENWGVSVYQIYSPPAPKFPDNVWVYFHKDTGIMAYVSECSGPVAPGYTARQYWSL